MWVKCRICGDDTYVGPAQQDDSAAYVCAACRGAARRRAKTRRDRLVMIVTALVLIGPLIYLTSQGGIESTQFCWGGLVMVGVAFYFTWRGRSGT